MFKLLSTAACALVLAAPGLAAAQGARPTDENAIEKPDPRAQARPDRQDRRQLRPDSPEERLTERRAERKAEERQPSRSAESKRPEGSATAPKDATTAEAKPDATPPKDSPTARAPTAPDKPKSSAAAPPDQRDSKPPQTSADTTGAKPAPGTASEPPSSQPPSSQPRAAQRPAADSATVEGSATGSATAAPPSTSPTRSTQAPASSPGESTAGATAGATGSTAQSSDPGTASGSATAAPESTSPSTRSLAAPAPTSSATPEQPQQRSATPQVGTAAGSLSAPLATQSDAAAQQPAAAQQQAAPEAQVGAAQAEPQAAAPAAEAAASTESDEDGVSSTEFLTGAGLALAPWVLQRILQGQGGDSVALVPQQGQYRYTQQPYGYPYVYDPQTGRYLDQRTGQIVEETTIIQRGDARRAGGQQARGGSSGQAGGQGQASSFAQGPQTNIPAPAQVVALSDWRYDDIYRSGWGADQLLGAEVNGRDGKPLGVVENILIGRDNQIASVLIKDQTQKTVANVPWDQVRMAGNGRAVTVPLTGGADLKQYSLFSGNNNLLVSSVAWMGPNAQQQSRTWKVTDLMNDYVTLASGNGYGYVDDVVFDGQGRLSAVVVYRDPSLGGGVAAYPFSAYGFEPWAPYYALPYDQNEVARVPEFQEERID